MLLNSDESSMSYDESLLNSDEMMPSSDVGIGWVLELRLLSPFAQADGLQTEVFHVFSVRL
ncbi:hypothetical protein [Planococcus salinus]|uniref:Uncharacterized protein n=1 Tax=Planococcus salinus TaxID=1848460 RepID=A0A3M8P8W6_9BACL|nr:hypothetical protein [Planococcus salinus]RNF39644.1 hypothetical protein EEX84_09240 [Planococcus salinus]